jgi:hypothetical protein
MAENYASIFASASLAVNPLADRTQRMLGRHEVFEPHRAEQRFVVRVGSPRRLLILHRSATQQTASIDTSTAC